MRVKGLQKNPLHSFSKSSFVCLNSLLESSTLEKDNKCDLLEKFFTIATKIVCIDVVSVCGITMCLSQLSLCEVEGSEKEPYSATRISTVAK